MMFYDPTDRQYLEYIARTIYELTERVTSLELVNQEEIDQMRRVRMAIEKYLAEKMK